MFDFPIFLSPVALDFFGLSIRWYSLSYIFGFLYFYWFASKHIKYFNLSKKKLEDLFFYSFLGIIIGGRFGYIVIYNINYYLLDLLAIFRIWEGGMSFHGALFGCTLSIIYFSKKNKISFFKITDLFSLTAPLGIMLGRIANFLNQELIGRKTEFFLSVRYSHEDEFRHISQIYESFIEGLLPLIILNILFFYFRVSKGFITGIFVLNYGLMRFLIEFTREPDQHIGFIFNYFSIGQLVSLPMIILGLIIINICPFKKKLI